MSTRAVTYLFQTRSRQPGDPPYDPGMPIKAWQDPSSGSDPVTYSVFDSNYNVVKLTLPKAQAEAVNFPGHDAYPAYVAVPAAATFNGGNFPFGVVSRETAEALATALGVEVAAITDAMAGFANTFPIAYGTETRRAWTIAFKGQNFLAADLVGLANANGVGAPGAWDLTGPTPVWVSHIAPTVAASDAVVMPVPIEPLASGETIIPPNIAVPAPMIETADAPAPTGTAGGGLLPDERAAVLGSFAILTRVFGKP